jgi:hypothetical protein
MNERKGSPTQSLHRTADAACELQSRWPTLGASDVAHRSQSG